MGNDYYRFLSTLPARGATAAYADLQRAGPHFYPRSPRGERRKSLPGIDHNRMDFYPRSPRGERPLPYWLL